MDVGALFGVPFAGKSFSSPWFDYATLAFPQNFRNALELCEYIFHANSTYSRAQKRIVSYFLTNIDVVPTDEDHALGRDERDKWQTILDDAEVLAKIELLNCDRACYGNAFASLLVPFRRHLISTASGKMLAFSEMAQNPRAFNLAYDAGKNKFMATDPSCEKRCEWLPKDFPLDTIRLKLWSPREIEIISDPYTGDCQYLWKIPEDYKREVRRGNMHILERAPIEVLKAVQHNHYFQFSPDALFHMKEPTLSGVLNRGWGLPQTLVNYRDIFHVQVLRRYNESIAMDYVIPFRVITPEPGVRTSAGTEDPLLTQNSKHFMSQVRAMLRRRRRDPATWNTLPYPIRYQALGGDANQLAPQELLLHAEDVMLNASGAAAELYRGTLQLQVAPVALRLFESSHHSLVHGNNELLRWFARRSTRVVSLPAARLVMQRVTYADDFNKQMAALQLFMGRELSGTTAFRGLGFDWQQEQKNIAEEESARQRLAAEQQEEMDQVAFGAQVAKGQPTGAAPGPAGMPPGPPGAGGGMAGSPMPLGSVSATLLDSSLPITPDEMVESATAIADQLMGLPYAQRRQELQVIRQKNEVLHSLVTAKLRQQRSQASSAGRSMMLGEQPTMVA